MDNLRAILSESANGLHYMSDMRSARLLLWLRSLIAAFLAASLIAIPAMAATEKPHEHAEIAEFLQVPHVDETHADHSDHNDAGHEHGCGTCHFHWMSADRPMALINAMVAPGAAMMTSEPVDYLASAGPYRPPRA
ncbi:hypothetical protein K1X12_14070 [Hyphomonas sp. WL0036]|uniref:hypothetical protein n=1 Tax=Hyphomonas sediminis TaxID=2866160 RepID=UPI001C7EC98A|nr:hypothetical protein [Hyphomonas sediminis]MBY9068034.1 hypothetical protein [Hyphomonas sediminis]